jgi:hypothetical protein
VQQDVVDVFARSPTKCFGNMLEVFNLMLYVYILYVYIYNYIYVYVICIYNICYRHHGKQVDRRNFNVLKDQGSQGSTDLFRPSYWAIDAEMLPTKASQ